MSEMKNSLDGINGKLDIAEEDYWTWIFSNWNYPERNREKDKKKLNWTSVRYGKISGGLIYV